MTLTKISCVTGRVMCHCHYLIKIIRYEDIVILVQHVQTYKSFIISNLQNSKSFVIKNSYMGHDRDLILCFKGQVL